MNRLDVWVLVITVGIMGYLWLRDLGKPKEIIVRRRQLQPDGSSIIVSETRLPEPARQDRPQTILSTAPVVSAPAVARPGGPATLASPTRAATVLALRTLAAAPTPPVAPLGTIPLLWDSRRWLNMQLGADGHWGIFGATGSGKGNVLQHLALSALHCGPDYVRVIVLDPKGGLDYAFCLDLPHAELYYDNLEHQVCTLSDGYKVVLSEMSRRHGLMLPLGARNLPEYHTKGGQRLPLLFVLADEVAELSKEQREMLGTIARMGRAAGIVLVVATQYPTVDVLSNQVQANLANRLVLRLESSTYTSVALRRTKEDGGTYEPAAIDRPGVGVLRRDGGQETIGVIPEMDDATRDHKIAVLNLQWQVSSISREDRPDELASDALTVPAVLSAKEGAFGLGTTGTTMPEQPEQPPSDGPKAPDDELAAIRLFLTASWSGNRIAKLLGGNRQMRYEQIRQVKAEMEAEIGPVND